MWMPSTKNRRASVVTARIPAGRDRRVRVKLRDVVPCNLLKELREIVSGNNISTELLTLVSLSRLPASNFHLANLSTLDASGQESRR